MRDFEHVTTLAAVDVYRATSPIFDGLLSEMRELSRKKPDATLNENKVKILNRMMEDLLTILKDEPEGKYLDLLDDEDLPQNSDAVLVMVQYEKALGAFQRRYYDNTHGGSGWVTEEWIDKWEKEIEK